MQTVPVTGAVIVTTPQDVALADAKKAIAMFGQAQLNVPVIGLVENMSYYRESDGREVALFDRGGVQREAESANAARKRASISARRSSSSSAGGG